RTAGGQVVKTWKRLTCGAATSRMEDHAGAGRAGACPGRSPAMNLQLLKTLVVWHTACALVLVISTCGAASAQCSQDWKPPDGFPGVESLQNVYALTTWDPDGAGPEAERLVVGGTFQFIADRVADTVAAFDPETGHWEDLGGGVDMPQQFKEGGPIVDTA